MLHTGVVESYATKHAALITELACKIARDKIELGSNSPKANKILDKLELAGIRLSASNPLFKPEGYKLSMDGNAGPNSGASVGEYTWQISNLLYREVSPSNSIVQDSPMNLMLPYREVPTMELIQEQVEGFYGWAHESPGPGGAHNVVPLLEFSGRKYHGFGWSERSAIWGNDIIALRKVGSSDTSLEGLMQRLSYQNMLLFNRQLTNIELVRIEAILKGGFNFLGNPISTGLANSNVTLLSGARGDLFTYHTTTNTISVNPTSNINVLAQLAAALPPMMQMGLEVVGILVPYTLYQAIFQTLAVQNRTVYTSAVSSNNMQEIKDNVFKFYNIPALMDIPIIVDNRSIKVDDKPTSKLNTRPLMYGKTVDQNSFRAVVLVRSTADAKVGELLTFPNVFARMPNPLGGPTTRSNFGNSIAVTMQDMSQFDVTNQTIQMFASSVFAPAIYQPVMVQLFDFNVAIAA